MSDPITIDDIDFISTSDSAQSPFLPANVQPTGTVRRVQLYPRLNVLPPITYPVPDLSIVKRERSDSHPEFEPSAPLEEDSSIRGHKNSTKSM